LPLLVERHGEEGGRICNLCKEVKATKGAVKKQGWFKKKNGEVSKYI
jgi:hypothetical protein